MVRWYQFASAIAKTRARKSATQSNRSSASSEDSQTEEPGRRFRPRLLSAVFFPETWVPFSTGGGVAGAAQTPGTVFAVAERRLAQRRFSTVDDVGKLAGPTCVWAGSYQPHAPSRFSEVAPSTMTVSVETDSTQAPLEVLR
jgi:hypothetical protein